MPRKCVFCGAPKVTREHVLPAWLSAVLPGQGRFYLAEAHAAANGNVQSQWSADRLDKTVKRVCRECNQGWMSTLEQEAKPVLTPLIQGQRRLVQGAQALIATWMIKTAMMCELGRLRPAQEFTPASHHRHVFEHQQPPPGSCVWAGGYAGGKTVAVHQRLLRLHSSTGEASAFASTITLGALLLQAFWFWDYPDGIEIQRGWGLPQLWPNPAPAGLMLPPDHPLSDHEVQQLADSFLSRR